MTRSVTIVFPFSWERAQCEIWLTAAFTALGGRKEHCGNFYQKHRKGSPGFNWAVTFRNEIPQVVCPTCGSHQTGAGAFTDVFLNMAEMDEEPS